MPILTEVQKQKRRDNSRRWRQNHPEQWNAIVKSWFSRNKDKRTAWNKRWRENNPERVLAMRRRRTAKVYGLSLAEYDALIAKQGNCCALCDKQATPVNAPTSRGGRDRLTVDHCHETGKVRGLLCHNCNRAIGLLCHNPKVLFKAITYLAQ